MHNKNECLTLSQNGSGGLGSMLAFDSSSKTKTKKTDTSDYFNITIYKLVVP